MFLRPMGPLPTCMHPLPFVFKNAKMWLCIIAPNCTPYIQACDRKMVNGAFKSSLEESCIQILIGGELCGVGGRSFDGRKKKKKRGPVRSRFLHARRLPHGFWRHLMQSPRMILQPHAGRLTSPRG